MLSICIAKSQRFSTGGPRIYFNRPRSTTKCYSTKNNFHPISTRKELSGAAALNSPASLPEKKFSVKRLVPENLYSQNEVIKYSAANFHENVFMFQMIFVQKQNSWVYTATALSRCSIGPRASEGPRHGVW